MPVSAWLRVRDACTYVYTGALAMPLIDGSAAFVAGADVQGLPSQRERAVRRAEGGAVARCHGAHRRPGLQCGWPIRAARRMAAQRPQQLLGRAVRPAGAMHFWLCVHDDMA
jgi:hypothetical protein